jgi:tetratricopeptide (TPR) repeat protein
MRMKEAKMTIEPTTVPHPLDASIQQLKSSIQSKPEITKFHAAIGVLYLRRNDEDQNDVTSAMAAFRRAIKIAPHDKDSVLAYSNRGQLYRMRGLFDKALEDLNNAKRFFGQISDSQQQFIENELNLVQQKMQERELQKKQPQSSTTQIPKLKTGGANLGIGGVKQYYAGNANLGNTSPVQQFFGQLILFMDGKIDSAPTAAPNSGSEIYWKAFGFCSKALNQEKKFGLTSHIRSLYFQASQSFEQLLGNYALSKKTAPSIIYYALATVYFKLELLEHSLEQVNLAIAANPDGDATYYRFRALLNEQLGKEDEAKVDEQTALEIDPNPEYYSMVISAFNEVNHCIEFYDEVILDETNYNTPDSIYASLADMGINIIPKRGKDLPAKEVLYAQRAMLSGILGRTDPEKLVLSLSDAREALSKLPKEHPLYLKVLIGRAQVHFYMKNYQLTLEGLATANEMSQDNPDILAMIKKAKAASQDDEEKA